MVQRDCPYRGFISEFKDKVTLARALEERAPVEFLETFGDRIDSWMAANYDDTWNCKEDFCTLMGQGILEGIRRQTLEVYYRLDEE